ncbi:MAG: thioredoxin [Chlamydiia bacterium]|nr:thioredoxin [Chlamydiia bacterium]
MRQLFLFFVFVCGSVCAGADVVDLVKSGVLDREETRLQLMRYADQVIKESGKELNLQTVVDEAWKRMQDDRMVMRIGQHYEKSLNAEEIAMLKRHYQSKAAQKEKWLYQEVEGARTEILQEAVHEAVQGGVETTEKKPSGVVVLTSRNYKKEVEASDRPIVIDAFATWCGPCKRMAPIFEEVSREMSDRVKFAKFDVDAQSSLTKKFSVRVKPTFIFIKNGQVVEKHIGSLSKSKLIHMIENVLL